MRHRATRPVIGLLLRLPRATARGLGLTSAPARTRALALLVAVLVLGGGGYAVVASVVGGSPSPQAGPTATAETSDPARTPATRRPDPAQPATSSADPTPTGRPEDPAASTSRPPEAPAPTTSDASPSAAGVPDAPTPRATGSGTPAPRTAATRAADLTSPQTAVSHEVTGPGEVLLTFSADETATFACRLDGAAYTPCASAESYSDLDPGWHTFTVRATDAAGNVDASPASTRWLSTPAGPEPSGDR